MRSPEHLRAEVCQLLEGVSRSRDATVKQTLVARALELAQEAEAIASLPNDLEGLRVKIAQYKYMLGSSDIKPAQRVVARLLRDAED